MSLQLILGPCTVERLQAFAASSSFSIIGKHVVVLNHALDALWRWRSHITVMGRLRCNWKHAIV